MLVKLLPLIEGLWYLKRVTLISYRAFRQSRVRTGSAHSWVLKMDKETPDSGYVDEVCTFCAGLEKNVTAS